MEATKARETGNWGFSQHSFQHRPGDFPTALTPIPQVPLPSAHLV